MGNQRKELPPDVVWVSPYQIVFGQQPNLPNVMTDKPPALAGTTSSKTVATHINALHSGRKAFLEAESAERVRRALRHKIRAQSECFQQGDRVYYKRQESNKWKGPGVVIGQDGKVILVRHGSIYVHVSSNRILKVGDEFHTFESIPSKVVSPAPKVKETYDSDEHEDSSSANDVVPDHINQNTEDEPQEVTNSTNAQPFPNIRDPRSLNMKSSLNLKPDLKLEKSNKIISNT